MKSNSPLDGGEFVVICKRFALLAGGFRTIAISRLCTRQSSARFVRCAIAEQVTIFAILFVYAMTINERPTTHFRFKCARVAAPNWLGMDFSDFAPSDMRLFQGFKFFVS